MTAFLARLPYPLFAGFAALVNVPVAPRRLEGNDTGGCEICIPRGHPLETPHEWSLE
jgi:hypothetical protein